MTVFTEDIPSQIQGSFTQLIYEIFSQLCNKENSVISMSNALVACRKFGVHPSMTQVMEIQVCCRANLPLSGLQFHEFCALIALLKSSKKARIQSTLNKPHLFRSLSGIATTCSVFLGGACNPTTWRISKAIPFLTYHGISYYNPQVSEWSPHLLELENKAKENATVLLFVLDPSTRGIASIVESAFLAGLGSNLVLVIPECDWFSETPLCCQGEQLEPRELEALQRSHVFLQDLIQRRGIPIFKTIESGLEAVRILVQKPYLSVRDLTEAEGAEPVRDSHVNVGEGMSMLREVFQSFDYCGKGHLTDQEVKMALTCVSKGVTCITPKSQKVISPPSYSRGPRNSDSGISDDGLEEDELETVIKRKTRVPPPQNLYNFADFCLLYAENLAAIHGWSAGTWKSCLNLLFFLLTIPRKLWNWLRPPPPSPPRYGVFLGGTCGGSTWREEHAEWKLRSMAVSYYNPRCPAWNYRHLPMEAAAREQCSVLLFVITKESWSSCCLAEAAHYIGLGKRVVLFVDFFQPTDRLKREDGSRFRLSAAARKDYNRGRQYLIDLAARAGVPAMDSIPAAVTRAAELALQD